MNTKKNITVQYIVVDDKIRGWRHEGDVIVNHNEDYKGYQSLNDAVLWAEDGDTILIYI